MTSNHPHHRSAPPREPLEDALAACLRFCDEHHGYNLPDLLASALTQIAIERGGSHTLIAHRPGSWEATHVQALAAGADPDHLERGY